MSKPTNDVDEIRKGIFEDIPVLGIGEALDRAEAKINRLIDEAYRKGVETAVKTHHKRYPDCPPRLLSNNLNTKQLEDMK